MLHVTELTQQQLQIIKQKRQKQQQQKKELQIKQQQRLQKSIDSKNKQIQKDLNYDIKQHNAAVKFLTKFTDDWKISINSYTKEYTIDGEYLDAENPSKCEYKRHIIWSKSVERNDTCITNGVYNITINQYFTAHDRWSTRNVSQGFRMYLPRDIRRQLKKDIGYASVKTILQKIKQYQNRVSYARKLKSDRKYYLELNTNKFKELIPNIQIKNSIEYNRISKDECDLIQITLQNNVYICYRMYSTGFLELKTWKILTKNYKEKIDQFKLVAELNKINTQELLCQTQN